MVKNPGNRRLNNLNDPVLNVLNIDHGSFSEPPMPGVKHALQNAGHHAK